MRKHAANTRATALIHGIGQTLAGLESRAQSQSIQRNHFSGPRAKIAESASRAESISFHKQPGLHVWPRLRQSRNTDQGQELLMRAAIPPLQGLSELRVRREQHRLMMR
ncbi:hypothetical protein TARUN_7241 [Trichoderma arundinaceum]|uniref:Uncharacterized protein n=1 Tax=Trichoderma arundinaceum TaxID=490622 RepID=A0A395NG77_TRIAR|nr:hypothetical protein TARUN_7241 [Trichoderma arundinaceum]